MAEVSDREEAMRPFRQLRDNPDRGLRDELLEEHRWIAVHCARRFADRGEPLDDLIQVGQIGLFKALERFDPEYGASFATFAVPTVLGEIRRHFRDATWAVRVPRRLKDLHVELGGATEHLVSLHGRAPTPEELAQHLNVGVDDVLEAIEAGGGYRPAPLTPPADDDERPSEGSALRVDDALLVGADDRIHVQRLLDSLPERERKIVELRFFGELSQSEIAELVGVSQVHVSRLLRSSLAALQRVASGESTD
ncbi:MAG: SigB/SigF/SigG family RNA polymerase sigma factor [Acidimicrobiales bacterium]